MKPRLGRPFVFSCAQLCPDKSMSQARRNQTFFSLAECNAAIKAALDRLNDRRMRKLGVSRRELFESIEKPALAPLPDADWEYAEWRRVRANLDYHVEVDGFYYSVPHTLRTDLFVGKRQRTHHAPACLWDKACM